MGTIYFAQYPLLSLILWANKKIIRSAYSMHEAMAVQTLSAPAGVEVPELGGGVPRPPSSVEVSKLRGLRFPQLCSLLRIPGTIRSRLFPPHGRPVSPPHGSNTRRQEAGWKGAHNVSLGTAQPGWVIW